ncbi:hypothetical protein NKI74_34020 [Mesorhizobium sp. M0494]|uniref:hypothetical protein n=1 Tax=Mesorhizobium sp. M0494 TaxID=2956951 RepID=UPI0033379995
MKPWWQPFLEALEPVRLAATLAAAERLENDREAALKQWRLDVERAQFPVNRAERRYRAVDPDNRLVARGLEQEWEEALRALEAAMAELVLREAERPRGLAAKERENLIALGADLASDWHAPTTTARDRKELLRTLIEEVTLHVDAMETLGLSRQSLLQRIKRGELGAVHVVRGQRKGLWIKIIDHIPTLLEHAP